MKTFFIVKEQRVNGGKVKPIVPNGLTLRYTLMGLETGYPNMYLSNLINNSFSKPIYSRFYSNLSTNCCSKRNGQEIINIPPLNPYFVTGFSDAEASFMILVLKEPKSKIKWTVKPRFTIAVHNKDIELLESIKTYFNNKGSISAQGKNSVQYRVSSLSDILNVIIPLRLAALIIIL